MAEIRVKVTKNGSRRFFTMYFDDPISGRRHQRSTKESKRKDAERAAAKWEAELREGRYKPASNVTWADFRQRYEDEVLPTLSPATGGKMAVVFNLVEKTAPVLRLRDLSAERISTLQAEMRRPIRDGGPIAEATIRTYLSHLRSALSWAKKMELIPAVPTFVLPKKVKGRHMKGRPITAEEFDRLLDKVEAGLIAATANRKKKKADSKTRSAPYLAGLRAKQAKQAQAAAPSWRHLLRGLWLSGLRLGESLDLWWDDDTRLCVDMSGRRPMFRILAEHEKGKQDRLLPMTPDFAEFLSETPAAERTGTVFAPKSLRGEKTCRDVNWVSAVIVAIGKAAGVKVAAGRNGKGAKFASAHDLRRSFGTRWAPRVMPAVLQQLMRHEDINTTMAFYVEQDAEALADTIWESEKVRTSVRTSQK